MCVQFVRALAGKSLCSSIGANFNIWAKSGKKVILLIKEPDAYIFTSEANHYQKLRREGITKGVNKVMRTVSKQLPDQPNIDLILY